MKKITCWLLAFSLFAGIFAVSPVFAAETEENAPITLSEYAGDTAEQHRSAFTYYDNVPSFLIGDPASGKVVLEKGSDIPGGIASMTKMMTYYIVKEDIAAGKYALTDSVTISSHAASMNEAGFSNYGLKAGESYSVEKLLSGLMVVSGNDAAIALAENAGGGSEQEFVARMNRTAVELGMTKSHFINSSGITENGEYNISTARDMFLLAANIVRKFPEVKDYSAIKRLDEPERSYSHASSYLDFIEKLPGTKGIKTGYTEEAGNCFTGLFEVKSTVDGSTFEIVTVLMGAAIKDARWRTTKELVDLAAGTYTNRIVVDESVPVTKYEIPNGSEESVVLYPQRSYSTFTYANRKFTVHYEITPGIKAPTTLDTEYGKITVLQDGEVMDTIPIIAKDQTIRAGLFTRLQRAASQIFIFVTSLF